MITNITLGNFKCFRHVSINPKLVTVLIGPNGTGKSGVLQALMLLKQSRDDLTLLRLQGDLVWFPPEAFVFRNPDDCHRPSRRVIGCLGMLAYRSQKRIRAGLIFRLTSVIGVMPS